MINDEALNIYEPQNELNSYLKVKKNKSERRSLRAYFLAICVLFILIVISCSYNFILHHSYVDIKYRFNGMDNKIKYLSAENSVLNSNMAELKAENTALITDNIKIKKENEQILSLLSVIKKQNDELMKESRQVMEDNIALQNSLKMAASVGIKPQNYTRFEGVTSRSNIDRGEYLGKFLGTAYTPSRSECGNNKGITNSGLPIIPGVSLAVDGKYWPFGTVFYIKGLGYAVAMDTGSAIKGKNRFDFAVFDKSFARILGERYWDVYLVKLGDGKIDDFKF